jgi:hypothetical protein
LETHWALCLRTREGSKRRSSGSKVRRDLLGLILWERDKLSY